VSNCNECSKPSEPPICTPCQRMLRHETALEFGAKNPDYHQRQADMWREISFNRLDH
jgi:hypothetical protein